MVHLGRGEAGGGFRGVGLGRCDIPGEGLQPAGKWSWALERGRSFSERDMVRFRQDCASALGADPSDRAGSEDGRNV